MDLGSSSSLAPEASSITPPSRLSIPKTSRLVTRDFTPISGLGVNCSAEALLQSPSFTQLGLEIGVGAASCVKHFQVCQCI